MRRRQSLPPEQLYPRRLAARALALALDGYGLTTVARRWNADDPAELLPGGDPGEFVIGDFADRWAPAARVCLEGARARVIVEHLDDVLRPQHRREFEAGEVGLVSAPGCPDINIEIDLSDLIEAEGDLLRSAPQRLTSPQNRPSHGPPRVISALRRTR